MSAAACALSLLTLVTSVESQPLGLHALAAQEPTSPVDSDPIARLRARIDAGDVHLTYDSIHGYVPALLAALNVPISSQNLVFSRTSLQTDRIAPWAPRALYFSDDIYIGWVQESPIIEIASIAPTSGALFFTLSQDPEGPPRFEREGTTCLMCHDSGITEGVPGLIMRSVLADRLGYPTTDVHEGQTTDRTPFQRRWGGWYVTGTHGTPGHSGNTRAPELYAEMGDRARYLAGFDLHSEGNVTDLSTRFDVERYLSPHSDIVSLMVLTHQVRVHNLIALVHKEGTRGVGGLAAQKPGFRSPSAPSVRSFAAMDRLVRAMLFVGEAELEGSVQGTSNFAAEFTARGPSDRQGRSLRDFDLERRLFRYPLSFLIYSDAFDALPEFALNHIYDRLGEILTEPEPREDFEHLTASDRKAIYDILLATKPAFAERIGNPMALPAGEWR